MSGGLIKVKEWRKRFDTGQTEHYMPSLILTNAVFPRA